MADSQISRLGMVAQTPSRPPLDRAFFVNIISVVLLFASLLVIYYGYMLHVSFFTDDWTILHIINQNDHGKVWGDLIHGNQRRPLMWLFYLVVFGSLQDSPAACVHVAMLLLAIEIYLIFKLLMRTGAPLSVAIGCCIVLLFCPLADSTRVWFSGSVATLAIDLTLCGLISGFLFLSTSKRLVRCVAWSATVIFYISAGLTYEAVLPFVALSFAIYFFTGYRFRHVATVYSAAVIPLIFLCVFYAFNVGPKVAGYQVPTIQYVSERAVVFVRETPAIISLMFSNQFEGLGWAVIASSGIAVFLSPTKYKVSKRLIIAGWIVVLLGYVPFLLAPVDIEPLGPGWVNRCNAFSSIGFSLVIYSLFCIFTKTVVNYVEMRAPNKKISKIFSYIFLSSAVLLGCGALARANVMSQLGWIRAGMKSNSVVEDFRNQVLPIMACGKNSSIMAANVPMAASPGFWVFENPIVLTGMVRSRSKCYLASAVQIDEYRKLACKADAIYVLSSDHSTINRWEYGSVIGFKVGKASSASTIGSYDACMAFERENVGQNGRIRARTSPG